MASEFLIVARRVLELTRRAMRPAELVDYAYKHKMFSHRIAGKTPHQTMKSKLSVHVRRLGEHSEFVRTKPGRFHLRELLAEDEQVYQARPQSKPNLRESVLVFPSALLEHFGRFQGVRSHWKRVYRGVLKPSNCTHMNRLFAESKDGYKQVLTYIMVTRKGRVLAFQRGSFNRVEDFLRGSHCIGFGGHVSEHDIDLFSSRDNDMGVTQSAVRELLEELRLPRRDIVRLQSSLGLTLVGILNDDSSAAGRRHFAFLFRYEVSNDPGWNRPQRGEKSITQLRWVGRNAKSVPVWNFEYWSQLCLREYFTTLLDAAPAYRIRRARALRSPHVLCVLGTLGSGKSEATRILTGEFGYTEVNSGRVLAKLLGLPPVPETSRDRFQDAAWDFIQQSDGPTRLATALWREVRKARSGKTLLDGIRQRTTLDALKGQAGTTRIGLLYVHTLPDIAYKFYNEREDRKLPVDEFLSLRDAPVEQDIDSMINGSDAILYNWSGKKAYRHAVRDLMGELGTR